MTGRLVGKIALITGAGCVGSGWGNGRAMAVRFAEEGAQIFAVDRDLERMGETIERVRPAEESRPTKPTSPTAPPSP